MSEFRTLDDACNLQDGNVNAYYLDDLKVRVSVARAGAKLFAFDDIYEGCPLSGGLLTDTTLMSQCEGRSSISRAAASCAGQPSQRSRSTRYVSRTAGFRCGSNHDTEGADGVASRKVR
jgi:hypothetical protein